jgi:hypothetical protein
MGRLWLIATAEAARAADAAARASEPPVLLCVMVYSVLHSTQWPAQQGHVREGRWAGSNDSCRTLKGSNDSCRTLKLAGNMPDVTGVSSCWCHLLSRSHNFTCSMNDTYILYTGNRFEAG